MDFKALSAIGDSKRYFQLHQLINLTDQSEKLFAVLQDHASIINPAPGSSHNHQAWPGGYLDHVTETMNIATRMYWAFVTAGREMPFTLSQALVVMFLHDLEKPWKHGNVATLEPIVTKEDRRQFRSGLIDHYGIQLTPEQRNALRYVEGVPDSEYTPGERTMGELAAFCHCCDILSARLWHDKGHRGAW